jgi:hypothetical protein
MRLAAKRAKKENHMSDLKDSVGTPYSSPDGKPAGSGVQVVIHTPSGPAPGTMVGGYVVPNK